MFVEEAADALAVERKLLLARLCGGMGRGHAWDPRKLFSRAIILSNYLTSSRASDMSGGWRVTWVPTSPPGRPECDVRWARWPRRSWLAAQLRRSRDYQASRAARRVGSTFAARAGRCRSPRDQDHVMA